MHPFAFHVVYDSARYVDTRCGLDPPQARRRVDLEHSRTASGLDDIDATERQLVYLGRPNRQIAKLAIQLERPRVTAAMQVGAEITRGRLPDHGSDCLAADDDHAQVLIVGFLDIFLHQRILLKVAEHAVDTPGGRQRAGQDDAATLGATADLEDDRKPSHRCDGALEFLRLTHNGSAGHGHTSSVKQLHAE